MALHQLWLVSASDLSPWCGGGFGMFSTTDGWGTRHLHAVAEGPGLRMVLEVPSDLDDDLDRTLALPTEDRLLALARALGGRTRFDLGEPDVIRVSVFARRHDARTLAPSGQLLRSVALRLDVAPPAP